MSSLEYIINKGEVADLETDLTAVVKYDRLGVPEADYYQRLRDVYKQIGLKYGINDNEIKVNFIRYHIRSI